MWSEQMKVQRNGEPLSEEVLAVVNQQVERLTG